MKIKRDSGKTGSKCSNNADKLLAPHVSALLSFMWPVSQADSFQVMRRMALSNSRLTS